MPETLIALSFLSNEVCLKETSRPNVPPFILMVIGAAIEPYRQLRFVRRLPPAKVAKLPLSTVME